MWAWVCFSEVLSIFALIQTSTSSLFRCHFRRLLKNLMYHTSCVNSKDGLSSLALKQDKIALTKPPQSHQTAQELEKSVPSGLASACPTLSIAIRRLPRDLGLHHPLEIPETLLAASSVGWLQLRPPTTYKTKEMMSETQPSANATLIQCFCRIAKRRTFLLALPSRTKTAFAVAFADEKRGSHAPYPHRPPVDQDDGEGRIRMLKNYFSLFPDRHSCFSFYLEKGLDRIARQRQCGASYRIL